MVVGVVGVVGEVGADGGGGGIVVGASVGSERAYYVSMAYSIQCTEGGGGLITDL